MRDLNKSENNTTTSKECYAEKKYRPIGDVIIPTEHGLISRELGFLSGFFTADRHNGMCSTNLENDSINTLSKMVHLSLKNILLIFTDQQCAKWAVLETQ